MSTRQKIGYGLFAVMLVISILAGASAQRPEQPIKLHIASPNVPADPVTKTLQLIAADLKEATAGMITSEITFQAFSFFEAYDNVLKGIADITYTDPPYTPGRFPISEVFGLPINLPNNQITGKAYLELYRKGYLDKEFADVYLVAVGSTSPYVFFWGKRVKPVTTLDDFRGKKISASGGPWSELIEVLGGIPVSGLSAPDCYMALNTGVIDGVLNVWPMIPVFKLYEVCSHVTDMSLCGMSMILPMNKESYRKLPKKGKEVLDKNVEKYSLHMTDGHYQFSELGKKMFVDREGTILYLSEAELEKMRKKVRPIFDKWVDKTEARGVPGKKILNEVYSILQGLGVKEPFARVQ